MENTLQPIEAQKKEINGLAFLHPIRLLFAIGILFWHMGDTNPFVHYVGHFELIAGNTGFLFISGMMFYLAYYKKLTSGALSTPAFFKKRFLKFFPLVTITVLFRVVYDLIDAVATDASHTFNYLDLFKSLTYFGNASFDDGTFAPYNGVIWFLAPLFAGYAISCLIILMTKNKPSVYWFVIPAVFALWGALTNYRLSVPVFFSRQLCTMIFNYFIGILFMHLIMNVEIKRWLRWVLGLFGLFNIVLYYVCLDKYNVMGNSELVSSIVIWAPIFAALYKSRVNVAFDNKAFKHIGAFTLHLWLWHQVLIFIIPVPKWAMVLIIAVWCIVSYICEVLIKKQISKKRAQKTE